MKEEIGLRIRNIRENMNLTKEELANMLGISGQFLGMIEKGKNSISIEKLQILCEITHLSADYILFGKDENLPNDTKKVLENFTDKQIETACKMLKNIALLIKKN